MRLSTHFHYAWHQSSAAARYRTGVSLHSHTRHSRERLDFLFAVLREWAPLRWAVQQEQRRRRMADSALPDFQRVWYTPPAGARQVWNAEAGQLEQLDLDSIVSLTDHDSIDAALELREDHGIAAPISLEWTVPFHKTFFHFGVHNLPPFAAKEIFRCMASYTANPYPRLLTEVLAVLHAHEDVLIVLNHPWWDEKGIGAGLHRAALFELLEVEGARIHALEVNGFRPWKENIAAIELAAARGLPVVAGGDRHGLEPNVIVNLTHAGTIEEFIEDVRIHGAGDVLFLPLMKESRRVRILHTICDVVRENPEHELGWRRWNNRFFYQNESGTVRSLTEIWAAGNEPAIIRHFVGVMQRLRTSLGHSAIRSALKIALADFYDAAPEAV